MATITQTPNRSPGSRFSQVSPVALRICIWCGVVFTALLVISFVLVMQFFPAPSPAASAAEISAMYSEHATRIRFGVALYVCAIPFIVPFAIAIAARCAQGESGFPIFSAIQVASGAVAVFAGLFGGLVWGTAAFRPGAIPASITLTLNDLGWVSFLLTWSPFAVWNGSIALSIFFDNRPRPAFPRWVAYFNLWLIVLYAPAGLMLFFKDGPFAYNGTFALWVPAFAFALWLVVMITMLLKTTRQPRDA